ncbi:MAG: hypothetical protein IPJ07_11010 [Acidobacteria bacterium]|nr:hypothetical protein [Acidobacteriota bacterium]
MPLNDGTESAMDLADGDVGGACSVLDSPPYTGGPLFFADRHYRNGEIVEECDRMGAKIWTALHASEVAARYGSQRRDSPSKKEDDETDETNETDEKNPGSEF